MNKLLETLRIIYEIVETLQRGIDFLWHKRKRRWEDNGRLGDRVRWKLFKEALILYGTEERGGERMLVDLEIGSGETDNDGV